jgi:chaperone BCS1
MLTRILGFSMFASVLDGGLGGGGFVNGAGENGGNGGGAAANAFITSLRLFLLGTLIETGRRLFQWVVERFKFFRVFLQALARNSS